MACFLRNMYSNTVYLLDDGDIFEFAWPFIVESVTFYEIIKFDSLGKKSEKRFINEKIRNAPNGGATRTIMLVLSKSRTYYFKA